jgi:hypothetical protein
MKRRRRRRFPKLLLKFGVEPIVLHARTKSGERYWRAMKWVRVPEPAREAAA